jgi:hypothetical protein
MHSVPVIGDRLRLKPGFGVFYSSLPGTEDALSQLPCDLRSGGRGRDGFADDIDDEWIMNGSWMTGIIDIVHEREILANYGLKARRQVFVSLRVMGP